MLVRSESDDTPKFIDAHTKRSVYTIEVSYHLFFSLVHFESSWGLLNMTSAIQVELVSQFDFLLETKLR